jgi:stage II sporulation protein D
VIRVAVADGLRSVEVAGGAVRVTDAEGQPLLPTRPGSVRVALRGATLEVEGRRAAAARLVGAGAGGLRLGGREYPGALEVLPSGGGLLVVNELPLDEYVAGVLRLEASDTWPREMLRAQAIVARTYAVYHRWLNGAKPFHLVASTAHQMYGGAVPEGSPLWAAVRETEGYVLLWEGQVFPAFYHTDSGGHTEDPRVVFTASNMPALRPVRSEFSGDSPHFAWNLELPLAHLSELLRRAGLGVGSVRGIEVLERSVSLRVTRLAVQGSQGRVQLTGADFRRLIGNDTLKSTLFAVAVDGQRARFAGRGYGHGVGLDQWGGKAMAEQGYTAFQILEYYYPGTALGLLR